ncbi:MAG: hypothetical protein WAS21_11520 [Geminicoccaceae bacterium]
MAAEPSIDEIMIAIRESGYLMEQEVATQLENLGFHVSTNVAFEDIDEGKSREMDVRAIKEVARDEDAKLSAYIEIIIECKNSSNPFVFIARPKNQVDKKRPPQEFVFPYKYEMNKALGGGRGLIREVPAFNHLGFDQIYTEHKNAWKAVQFCRIDRKGSGWHANHGGLYDAIFYPMAKAITARKAEIPKRTVRPDEWKYFWFFFPVVVTSGDLMIIDSTDTKPTPRPVDHVGFTRELKSGKLSGSFSLSFVRQQHLEAFVATVIEPIGGLASDLLSNRLDFVKNTALPWTD